MLADLPTLTVTDFDPDTDQIIIIHTEDMSLRRAPGTTVKGAKGDKGDNGAAGAVGPAGPAGANGAAGAQGIQGPAGPQGPQGIQGPAGASAGSDFGTSYGKYSFLPAQSIGRAFTKVALQVVDDPNGLFSAANNWYVAPYAGYFVCMAKVRYADSSPATSHFVAAGVNAPSDGSFGQWANFNGTRFTQSAARVVHLAAGDKVMLVSYWDAAVNGAVADGELTVYCAKKD